eukprot:m.403017 g.403017  ORF g.403017 m.403017 type:complete len:121 (+) comp16787_c0_seq1:292-654(+)
MSGATEENMSSASRLNAKFTEWRVIWDKHRMTDKSLVLARVLICSYFFNQAYTGLEIWYEHCLVFSTDNAISSPPPSQWQVLVSATLPAAICVVIAAVLCGLIRSGDCTLRFGNGCHRGI